MAILASDSFDGASGSTIQAANTDWTLLSGPSMSITPSGRARLPLAPGGASVYSYFIGWSPADYEVSLDVYIASSTTDAIGPSGRIQSSSLFYHARHNRRNNNWELYLFNGGATLLGSWGETVPIGATRRVALRMEGSDISLLVDGTPRVVVSNTVIETPGLPGLRGITEGATNNAGLHIDNWVAESIEPTVNIPAAYEYMKSQGIS